MDTNDISINNTLSDNNTISDNNTDKINTNKIDININWFITLSNKIDYYLEQMNNLNNQINTIKEDLNNTTLINAYNTKELINIKSLIEHEIANNQVLKSNIDTVNARLNDNILNISYMDDKLQEINNNLNSLSEQFNERLYDKQTYSQSNDIY